MWPCNKLLPRPLIHGTKPAPSNFDKSSPTRVMPRWKSTSSSVGPSLSTWTGRVPYKRHPTYMCQTWFLTVQTTVGAQLYGRISWCGLFCGELEFTLRFELFIRLVLAVCRFKPIFSALLSKWVLLVARVKVCLDFSIICSIICSCFYIYWPITNIDQTLRMLSIVYATHLLLLAVPVRY